MWSSLLLEELLHQLAALVFQNAGRDSAAGMQGLRSQQCEAALFVVAAVDDAGNLAPAKGSGTHGARLYGNIECTVGQVFAAQFIGGGSDSLHLGMSRDVVQRLCQVMGARYHTVLTYDDGTDGYLALVEGLLRLLQSLAHILFVFGHVFFAVSLFSSFRSFAK